MTISDTLRKRIHETAKQRCGYCRMPASFIYAIMEIDRIIPKSKGGTDEEENLWLACPRCNLYKSDQTQAVDPATVAEVNLFNPRNQVWLVHFEWQKDDPSIIFGKTPCGRATIMAMKLNIKEAVSFRNKLMSAGWHPPQD